MKKFLNVLPRYRVMLVRESEDTFTKYPKFHNSRELFEGFREELAAFDREHFCMITLDSKNRTIGYHTISVGSLSSSIVHARRGNRHCWTRRRRLYSFTIIRPETRRRRAKTANAPIGSRRPRRF
jgi:hypothetical protein